MSKREFDKCAMRTVTRGQMEAVAAKVRSYSARALDLELSGEKAQEAQWTRGKAIGLMEAMELLGLQNIEGALRGP